MNTDINKFRKASHSLEVSRETEKAIAATVVATVSFRRDLTDERTIEKTVWFPKAWLRNGQLSGARIIRKLEDAFSSTSALYVGIESIGGVEIKMRAFDPSLMN